MSLQYQIGGSISGKNTSVSCRDNIVNGLPKLSCFNFARPFQPFNLVIYLSVIILILMLIFLTKRLRK